MQELSICEQTRYPTLASSSTPFAAQASMHDQFDLDQIDKERCNALDVSGAGRH